MHAATMAAATMVNICQPVSVSGQFTGSCSYEEMTHYFRLPAGLHQCGSLAVAHDSFDVIGEASGQTGQR